MREQSQKLQVASEKSQDLEAVAFGSWIWKGSMKNTVTHLWDLQGGYENQLWQLWFIYVNLDSLWLFNIAMENGPFTDDFPSYKPPFIRDVPNFPIAIAMLNKQMVDWDIMKHHGFSQWILPMIGLSQWISHGISHWNIMFHIITAGAKSSLQAKLQEALVRAQEEAASKLNDAEVPRLEWLGAQPKCGYGSIPISINFNGMNIHLPASLMFTRGTRFWHTAKCLILIQVG